MAAFRPVPLDASQPPADAKDPRFRSLAQLCWPKPVLKEIALRREGFPKRFRPAAPVPMSEERGQAADPQPRVGISGADFRYGVIGNGHGGEINLRCQKALRRLRSVSSGARADQHWFA